MRDDIEENADSDRGRVLFSAPFRRLQNKAQVFSLETNAAVRSRLTHSLEVSSIGRFIAQQALATFSSEKLVELGLAGKERALVTFVETACLIHDIGNPPFGHFGELAISDWFHNNETKLVPEKIGGPTRRLWDEHYADFVHFDGNPQGFRIVSRLQASATADMNGLNLTAATLAATLKYPWASVEIGKTVDGRERKKCGYFRTEDSVIVWLWKILELGQGKRHPLAFLMEAADDVAYCVSDIEDGIEKGLVDRREFAEHMNRSLAGTKTLEEGGSGEASIGAALELLADPVLPATSPRSDGSEGPSESLTAMQDFRSGVMRYLASRAGKEFVGSHSRILEGSAQPLLQGEESVLLLDTLKTFAMKALYYSSVVRDRELTAQAAISGLLDAYMPLMNCDRSRFEKALAGEVSDRLGRKIAREGSLMSRMAKKYLAVYHEAVRCCDLEYKASEGYRIVMERIYRIHLIVDYIAGMTDEFALQSFHLVVGSR